MLDPTRVLVTGYANAVIEGTAAEPAVKNVLVGQLMTGFALLLSEKEVKHRIRVTRTSADDPGAP